VLLRADRLDDEKEGAQEKEESLVEEDAKRDLERGEETRGLAARNAGRRYASVGEG
jgi:hypothetical protein